jgi:hypothetical protein
VVVTLTDFRDSLAGAAPAAGFGAALQALWWAGKDDWTRAHKLVMESTGTDSAWVHAYLHRVEGDLANANYWYRQAGQSPAAGPLDKEWGAIATTLLSRA